VDGSCLNNGKDNATAGDGIYWGPNHTWNENTTEVWRVGRRFVTRRVSEIIQLSKPSVRAQRHQFSGGKNLRLPNLSSVRQNTGLPIEFSAPVNAYKSPGLR
jgi:hypothetical protein